MSTKQNPTLWFNQFLPAPEGWEHPQWCWRHWAPAPVYDANGIGASVEVMQDFISTTPFSADADEMNERMEGAGKLCCQLGDERMYEIWGHWPPAEEKTDEPA